MFTWIPFYEQLGQRLREVQEPPGRARRVPRGLEDQRHRGHAPHGQGRDGRALRFDRNRPFHVLRELQSAHHRKSEDCDSRSRKIGVLDHRPASVRLQRHPHPRQPAVLVFPVPVPQAPFGRPAPVGRLRAIVREGPYPRSFIPGRVQRGAPGQGDECQPDDRPILDTAEHFPERRRRDARPLGNTAAQHRTLVRKVTTSGSMPPRCAASRSTSCRSRLGQSKRDGPERRRPP